MPSNKLHGQKYEETVLIKLRRNYGKDEAVLWALNKINSLKSELKSTKEQLNKAKDDLHRAVSLRCVKIEGEVRQRIKNEIVNEIALTPEQKVELRANKILEDYKNRNIELSKRNNKLEKDNKELIHRLMLAKK